MFHLTYVIKNIEPINPAFGCVLDGVLREVNPTELHRLRSVPGHESCVETFQGDHRRIGAHSRSGGMFIEIVSVNY